MLEGYGFDGETSACSTSSGMAAIMTAVQPFLVHKRHHAHEPRNFLATAQCYGGTFQQFNVRLTEERDIECRWIEDPTDLDEWASKIDKDTRFLYGELPSNPGMGFFDISEVADLAHSHNLPLIVDSTVATPALLRPIYHGADIVVQSTSKTITSSGFGICGAVIARKGLVTNIDNDTLKRDFSLYIKYLPNRDYGPNLHPMQVDPTWSTRRSHAGDDRPDDLVVRPAVLLVLGEEGIRRAARLAVAQEACSVGLDRLGVVESLVRRSVCACLAAAAQPVEH